MTTAASNCANMEVVSDPTHPGTLYDREAVVKALHLLVEPGQVVELRILGAVTYSQPQPHVEAGFFDGADKLADALAAVRSWRGVYFSINPVDPALLQRSANRLGPAVKGQLTQDTDIVRRRWILLDIDPRRPTGVSSTGAEFSAAAKCSTHVRGYLKERGWPAPISAMSGNGIHLLYRVDLPADDGGLVRRCLESLAKRFDSKEIQIDRTVHNPARIGRLYGTLAAKGTPSADRPHRMARILFLPGPAEAVPFKALEEVAAEAKGCQGLQKEAAVENVESRPLDVEAFIRKHGLEVQGPEPWNSHEGPGRRWVLKTSPMCEHHDGAAFIVQLGNGAIQAGCLHASCSWGWSELRAHCEATSPTGLVGLEKEKHDTVSCYRPNVKMPGEDVRVSDAAKELGGLLGATGTYFNREGSLVAIRREQGPNPSLELVRPAAFPSVIESVCQPMKRVRSTNKWAPTICTKGQAEIILAAKEFQDALPHIQGLTRCPALLERGGQLVEVTGYDRFSGVYAGGAQVSEVSFDQAKGILNRLLGDFNFASESDRSRAMAAIITPAFVQGGLLLPGRAPFTVLEADQSQTGKGYLVRLIAAVYGDTPATVTPSKRGPGALEDAFDVEVAKGRAFISLDNVRGKFDSPKLESFATEPQYIARLFYVGPTPVDPRRINVCLTSNRAELTTDLSNRVSTIRLLKQPASYRFAEYPEGSILEHVQANQGLYLGAVFSLVRAWHAAGKPADKGADHDFRQWCWTLNWIVRDLLGEEPLMDGHRAIQRRTTHQGLTWLRSLAIAVEAEGSLGQWLRPNSCLHILQQAIGVEIPGLKEGDDLGEDVIRNRVFRAIGKRLSDVLKDADEIGVDEYSLARRDTLDGQGRRRTEYRITRGQSPKSPESTPQVVPEAKSPDSRKLQNDS